jgi:uncharacterized protein
VMRPSLRLGCNSLESVVELGEAGGMMPRPSIICPRRPLAVLLGGSTIAAVTGFRCALAGGTDPTSAAFPDQLVTATVRADAPGRSDRAPALRRALGIVLARLSGNPALEKDPRVLALDPAPLMLDLSYEDVLIDRPLHDEQGSYDRPFLLTVRFAEPGLRAMLAVLGERPWPGPRPRIAPMLALRYRDRRETTLTADDPLVDRARAALTAAGARYAIPIALPLRDAAAAPVGAIPIEGRVEWVEAEFGWRTAFQLSGQSWGMSGASLDEAFRLLVGGAALRLRPGGVAAR